LAIGPWSLSPRRRWRNFLNLLNEKGKKVSCRKGEKVPVKPFKPGTLNRYIACAKTIVNRALANRLIDRNTLLGLKLYKENNVRDRVLARDEYDRLLAECPRHLKLVVELAYMTGMRQGRSSSCAGTNWI